ncbi:MAG TPA: molybdate ABC transporter substrate-binding protein [Thermoanaerobaculia bacterium]|nr:molybdate ABC transporter substrate-binding protein [Thermoanaerobaculia bacterium]
MRKVLALLLLAAAAVCPTLRAADPKPELLVFGAASLTESLQDLGAAWTAKTGQKVSFSFAGSSDLARQIQAGAPADVFFSADTAKMNALEKAGLVKAADRREFLSNALVVMVPKDSTAKVTSAQDLTAFSKIALADPAAVPVGVYAKKWLTGLGLWDRIEPKLVPTLDVRGSLSAVESGGVDAAIVYRTDAAIAKSAKIVYTVTDGPEILYSVAPVASSKHGADAAAFVAFLAGPDGRAEFEKRGFLVKSPK